jgi:ABC-type transporter Mla subunit MlaD
MGSLGAGALGAKNVSVTLNVVVQTFSAMSDVSTSLNHNLPQSGDTFEQSASKFNNFASEFTKAYNTTQKSFSNSFRS